MVYIVFVNKFLTCMSSRLLFVSLPHDTLTSIRIHSYNVHVLFPIRHFYFLALEVDSFSYRIICAGLMQFCTIPLDTAKVRLQLQKKAAAGDSVAIPKYRGMLGTIITIFREEGLTALWTGLVPGLHRQCLYGGLRIGLYEPVSYSACSNSKFGSRLSKLSVQLI